MESAVYGANTGAQKRIIHNDWHTKKQAAFQQLRIDSFKLTGLSRGLTIIFFY